MDYGRGARSLLMTAMLVVLLGLVAFSSRSGFGSSDQPAVSNTYISYAMSIFLIVFVLMIPVAIYSYFVRTKEMGDIGRAPGKQFRRTIYALVFIGIALYVRRYIHAHGGLFGNHGLFHIDKKAVHVVKGKGTGAHGQTQPHFEWIVLWIFLAVAAAASIPAYIAYKRRPPMAVRELPTLAEEFAAGISDAIDDLERESDPRKAVIAAYARMERTFGREGLARNPSETAIEYLRRVLHQITSRSGEVETLTSLFERAKFSKHEITPDMKNEAIASLRVIRESIA